MQHVAALTTTFVLSSGPEMEAHVEVIVHLMVAPEAGVTPNSLVWVVPGQVDGFRETMQSAGGLMFSVSEQELVQPFVSVIVSVTLTLPVILGIATATVLELPPAELVGPPL